MKLIIEIITKITLDWILPGVAAMFVAGLILSFLFLSVYYLRRL